MPGFSTSEVLRGKQCFSLVLELNRKVAVEVLCVQHKHLLLSYLFFKVFYMHQVLSNYYCFFYLSKLNDMFFLRILNLAFNYRCLIGLVCFLILYGSILL